MRSCLELLLPDEFGLSDQTALVPDGRPLGAGALGAQAPASRRRSEEDLLGSRHTAEEALGKESNGGNNGRRQEEEEKECLDARMEENPPAETLGTVEGREELRAEEEEEEETGMKDVSYEDVFIRNSGLISHAYTLNINVESGVYHAL